MAAMTHEAPTFDYGLSTGTALLLDLEPLLEALYTEVDPGTLFRLGHVVHPLTRPGAGVPLVGELRYWANFLGQLEDRPGADTTKVGRFRKVLEQLAERLDSGYEGLVDPLARDPWLGAVAGSASPLSEQGPDAILRLWENLDPDTRRRHTARWQRQLAPFQAAADALLRLARDSITWEEETVGAEGLAWMLPDSYCTGLVRMRPERAGHLPVLQAGQGSVGVRLLDADTLEPPAEPVQLAVGWFAW